MDKRESRSKGGLPSSNAPTVTSRRFSHRIREVSVRPAGKWINECDARDGNKKFPQKVIYSSSRERRVDEEASSRVFSGKPDEKSQLKIEIDENCRSRLARCKMNWEEVESKERIFKNP